MAHWPHSSPFRHRHLGFWLACLLAGAVCALLLAGCAGSGRDEPPPPYYHYGWYYD